MDYTISTSTESTECEKRKREFEQSIVCFNNVKAMYKAAKKHMLKAEEQYNQARNQDSNERIKSLTEQYKSMKETVN